MLRRRGSQQAEETLGALNRAHGRTAAAPRKEAAVGRCCGGPAWSSARCAGS